MIARIKFTKTGSAKFIGHLDLLRYFQKAFRRAKLDMTYSQGYSPRPITTFAAPLGVGLTSKGEYLDITLNTCDDAKTMIDRINKVMANNIRITDFIILPDDSKNAMSVVAAADYTISLKDGYDFLTVEEFENEFTKFYNQETIKIVKKTKKSEVEMDLKPLIYKFDFLSQRELNNISEEEDRSSLPLIYLQLATGSVNNIKADLVLETFCKYADIPYNTFAFDTHRLELYADVSKDHNRKLVPLNKMYN